MFVDRQSTYPNRYKITTEAGVSSYVVLERADEPTVPGTPLNAATLNELESKITGTIPMNRGGTGATQGATGLKNLFAAGATELSPYQYGDTLPENPVEGQLFFLLID